MPFPTSECVCVSTHHDLLFALSSVGANFDPTWAPRYAVPSKANAHVKDTRVAGHKMDFIPADTHMQKRLDFASDGLPP